MSLNYTTLRDLLVPIGETTYESIYWTERDFIFISLVATVMLWAAMVCLIELCIAKENHVDDTALDGGLIDDGVDDDQYDDQYDDQADIPTEPNSPDPSPDYDQSPLDNTSDLPLGNPSTIQDPPTNSSWVARSYCNTARFDWSKVNPTPRSQKRVRSIDVSLKDYTVDEYPIGYMRLDNKTRAIYPIRRMSH